MPDSRLVKIAWRVYAVDAALGALLIIAALTDTGDAAGRGLAQVYAVGCVIALLGFAVVLGVSTILKSTVGLWISIVLMLVPPVLYLIGVVRILVD
ncbi:MAG TPA: hypothetical protein VF424_02825 [Vicinamibacterales bacterium]